MRWFTHMGKRVFLHEWWIFFFRDKLMRNGPTLAEFWGAPQDHEEIPLRLRQPKATKLSAKDTAETS